MKPTIQDIRVEQQKANFINFLINEFGENEFTNSEMKKHYGEAVTAAIENASKATTLKGLKAMFNDSLNNWISCVPVKSYNLYRNQKKVHVVFDTKEKSVMDIPYYELVRYIEPSLDFPKSYALNKTIFNCFFFTSRKETFTIKVTKAVGRFSRWNGRTYEKTIYSWENEEDLGRKFDLGYSIKTEEVEGFRYYFKLNIEKAKRAVKTHKNISVQLREERTKALVIRIEKEDRQEIFDYLSEHYFN